MERFILMLEEDSDDRYITEQTLLDLAINIPVKFLTSSTDFFNFLFTHDKPILILIDYNSAPDNGIAVLRKLKSHPDYYDIPVIILSDSDQPRYKNECYQHGASSFIKKPQTVEATNRKIASFFNYWFHVVEV